MVDVETADSSVFVGTADSSVLGGLWLDEDLLREEFEAIIAAEYPAPRPPRTTRQVACCGGGRQPVLSYCNLRPDRWLRCGPDVGKGLPGEQQHRCCDGDGHQGSDDA